MNTVLNSFVDQVLRSFEEDTSLHANGSRNGVADYEIVNFEDEPGFSYEPIPPEERDPSLTEEERRWQPRGRLMYYLDNIGSLEGASSGSLTYLEHNGIGQYVLQVNNDNEEDEEDSDTESMNSDGHSSLESTDLSFDENSDSEFENDLNEEDIEEESRPAPKPSCFISGPFKLRSN